nr:hypothetical protein [Asgard group archaeon]
MNNNTMKIGAFVLETLTTGMYTNPLDCLREYVQNSFDSIREAERGKYFKCGAGRITINIDEKNNKLSIHDNGVGVNNSNVLDNLINIGMSKKNFLSDAGFRGIGRLAGVAYCSKLIFRTQGIGDTEEVSLV